MFVNPHSRPWRLALVLLAALTACTGGPPVPPSASSSVSPTATTAPRDFTVVTAEHLTTTDPAVVTTDVGAIMALNLYQRLMLVQPGTGILKPDLAADCLFTADTVYECQLRKDLVFSNGHALTSSDVRFSVLRALRLQVPGTSLSLINSLDRIEVPDAQTVRFRLLWPDTRFGYGLATPGLSIVDEEYYDPDAPLPLESAPVGSGPYTLTAIDDDGATLAKAVHYVGPDVGEITPIRLRYGDSAAAEASLAEGTADVIWRTLDAPALARLQAAVDATGTGATASGFLRVPMANTVVRRLVWNPDSARRRNAPLRRAVARALQADRTLDSLVPPAVTGHVAAFAVGGTPKITKIAGKRIALRLSYPAAAPGLGDLARLLRDRVENSAGVSVHVVADDPDADLRLTERGAWVNTAMGWLQEYLDDPLPASRETLADLEREARSAPNADDRLAALVELQKQAARDATVLPVAALPGTLVVRQRLELVGEAFGPGWQLGLWGFRWRN